MTMAPEVEDSFGPVKEGWYINGCYNIYCKLTPKPNTMPPEYRTQCMCFALEWFIPVPCCCCPAADFTLAPDDPDAPADEQRAIAIYVGGNDVVGRRHIWTDEGKFVSKGGSSKESMKWIRSSS